MEITYRNEENKEKPYRPGEIMNRALPEYKSEGLPFEPICSVQVSTLSAPAFYLGMPSEHKEMCMRPPKFHDCDMCVCACVRARERRRLINLRRKKRTPFSSVNPE